MSDILEEEIRPFEDLGNLAGKARLFLGISIGLYLLSALITYSKLGDYSTFEVNGSVEEVTPLTGGEEEGLLPLVGSASLVISIVTAFFALRWLYVARRNLPALGAKGLRYAPWWSVGGFFIPIFSLFRPFQVVSEVWKASDPGAKDGLSWQDLKVPPLIIWCYVFYLLSAFVTATASVMMLTSTEGAGSITRLLWSIIAMDIYKAVYLGTAILVVTEIETRQVERYRRRRDESYGREAVL